MTNNQLTENSVNQLLNSVRLARDNAERADNRVDHSFYFALTIALEELQERRKVNADLTMWVKRLGYSLKRAKPDSKLPGNAMAYLNAKGLISVEDILR